MPESMPKNYELAEAYTAGEFLDEDCAEWFELVPEVQTTAKFVKNESSKYKYEIWLPTEVIEKINQALKEKYKKGELDG